MNNYNNNGLYIPWNIELRRLTDNVELLGEFSAKTEMMNIVYQQYENRVDLAEIVKWYNDLFEMVLESVANREMEEQARDENRNLWDRYEL